MTRLDPDQDHPNGGVICIKGKAAPELVYNTDRLNYPLKRTRPKGDPDPGWQRMSWDQALNDIAQRLTRDSRPPWRQGRRCWLKAPRAAHQWMMSNGGSGVFSTCSVVRTGFQQPTFATGTGTPASASPSARISRRRISRTARRFLLWGHNPSSTSLVLAHDIVAARARGMKTVVVDPRRIGIGSQADMLLQVRPGTDGALALAMIHCLMEESWYDASFARQWTNGPFLLNSETGEVVTEADLTAQGAPTATSFGMN